MSNKCVTFVIFQGHATFIGLANSFFHMIMYAYRVIFCHMFPNTPLYKKRKQITFVIFVSFSFNFSNSFIKLIFFLQSQSGPSIHRSFSAHRSAFLLQLLRFSNGLCLFNIFLHHIHHYFVPCFNHSAIVIFFSSIIN